MQRTTSTVLEKYADRQWDARFNIPNDKYLETLLENIRNDDQAGRFKYILVGGIEIGTRANQDDYEKRHVHIAAIFHNPISKSAILKNWGIDKGCGFYLVPRNRNFPYSGWRNHHTKAYSKVDPNQLVIFESGQLPGDVIKKAVEASMEEKKRKLDHILLEMRDLLSDGKDEECFQKFPKNYIMYGERVKSMIAQKKMKTDDHAHNPADPHIWLFGLPGTGKTSILQFIYPNSYKKNLYNKFFDLFDPKTHGHIILEDLDHEAVERLSINFIKTLCDKQGFAVDQKYKTPQLASCSVLVTSNFSISDIIPIDQLGYEQNKAAIMRRFFHVRIDNFMRLVGLKLLPVWDRKKLQQEGNTDMGKLFVSWDYTSDRPKCEPIGPPEFYQEQIRKYFYS